MENKIENNNLDDKLKIMEAMDQYLPEIDGVVTCMHNYCLNLNNIAKVTAVAPKYKRGYKDELPYEILRCRSSVVPFINVHYGSPNGDAKFNKELMAHDFDIIHIHSPFNMAKYAMKVAKKKNIPLVATFHTNFRPIFQNIFKAKWITESIIQSIGNVYNKCDEIFVCSPQIAEQARSFGYTGKTTILPFGSDYKLCDDVAPLIERANKTYNLDKDELVFLFTGRVMELKRIDFIIDALKICKDKGLKFKFFVAGKGMYMDTLKKQVKKLEMENEVNFLGFVEQSDLDSLYARANLLLFPSLYDNFGLVKVEAAAFWTAGIYIRDSQAGYGVTHNQNGFLTDDNLEAFAQGILDATSDREKLKQVGINASKQLYISWEDCTKILLNRLKEIVEEKKGKKPNCAITKSQKLAKLRENYSYKKYLEINKRARNLEKMRKQELKDIIDKLYE